MTWTTLTPEEKDTIYQSASVASAQIAADLKTVVDRMTENREEDHADAAEELLFLINATNGFIKIMWWNNGVTKPVGDWVYELGLETLWEGEDAFRFDDVCRNALYNFTEDHMYTEEGDPVYAVFVKTELSDISELIP